MTASISTILKLARDLIGHLHDIRHASREQKELETETQNLCGLLNTLRFRVEGAQSNHKDPWFNEAKVLGVENGPLDQYKHVLEGLLGQIPAPGRREQTKSALTWPFKKRMVEEALRRMERLKSLIQWALSEDTLWVILLIEGFHFD